MAEVVLFHHALGLTPGVVDFAHDLRGAGHTVHAPDLCDGRTFKTLEDGLGHAEQIGFGEVIARGVRAVEGLPGELVYAGFSLGVLPAQKLTQTRRGARGALLFYSCGSTRPAAALADGSFRRCSRVSTASRTGESDRSEMHGFRVFRDSGLPVAPGDAVELQATAPQWGRSGDGVHDSQRS
jgi:dienelactone hydrolase